MVRITLPMCFVAAVCITICMAAAIPDPAALDISTLGDIRGGDAVCASARRQVISTLRATSREVQRVGTGAGARNAVVRNAVRRAQTGMREATNGITQVAFTLLGGDEPTQESRDLIAKGFGGVKTALDAMGASRPNQALTTRITRARTSLNRAISAGNRLVVDCGGSDPIPISTANPESAPETSRSAPPPRPTRNRSTIILTTSRRTTSTASTPAPTVSAPAETEAPTTTTSAPGETETTSTPVESVPATTDEEGTSISVLTVTEESTAVITQTVVQTVNTATLDSAPSPTPGDELEGLPPLDLQRA